jgi:hypothetical protein
MDFFNHIRLKYPDVVEHQTADGDIYTGCFGFKGFTFKQFQQTLLDTFRNRNPIPCLIEISGEGMAVMNVEHVGRRESGWDDLFGDRRPRAHESHE